MALGYSNSEADAHWSEGHDGFSDEGEKEYSYFEYWSHKGDEGEVIGVTDEVGNFFLNDDKDFLEIALRIYGNNPNSIDGIKDSKFLKLIGAPIPEQNENLDQEP